MGRSRSPTGEGAPFLDDEAKPAATATGQRHVTFALCFVCSALCYADRTNLSVALVAMRREFGWDDRDSGMLLAAFFFGYLFTQIPGGLLSVRYGAKVILICGVCVWSSLTIITPFCAYRSKHALLGVRVLVGLAEGVAIPATQSLIAAWSPPIERSRWLSLVGSGAFVGTVLAFSCARLVEAWWPAIFYLFGSLGFAWALAFGLLATSSPADHPRVSSIELALIRGGHAVVEAAAEGEGGGAEGGGAEGGGAPGGAPSGAPGGAGGGVGADSATAWRLLLSTPAFAGICAGHFSINWGHYLLLSWLPQFLTSLGLRLGSAAALFAAPYFCATAMDNLGGWVADEVLQRRLRYPVQATRRIMQGTAHGTCIVCFGALCFTHDPLTATALLTVAISGSSLSHAGYWPNLIDICGGRPKPTAVLTGVANTVGTLPGILANWLTGWMLSRPGGSWRQVFALAVCVYTVGGMCFLATAKGHDLLAERAAAQPYAMIGARRHE